MGCRLLTQPLFLSSCGFPLCHPGPDSPLRQLRWLPATPSVCFLTRWVTGYSPGGLQISHQVGYRLLTRWGTDYSPGALQDTHQVGYTLLTRCVAGYSPDGLGLVFATVVWDAARAHTTLAHVGQDLQAHDRKWIEGLPEQGTRILPAGCEP